MRTGAEDHQSRVGAIDHASHSLAMARESLAPESPTVVPPHPVPVQARVRAEVGRVARLLEEAREPGRIAPETIDEAAHALDRELAVLAGKAHPVRAALTATVIQTRLEERDGGTWITGLCPFCWERVAVLTAADETAPSTLCSSGHRLAVVARRSAGP